MTWLNFEFLYLIGNSKSELNAMQMHSQNYQIQYIYSSFFSKKCTSMKDPLLQIKTWLNPKICQFNPIW